MKHVRVLPSELRNLSGRLYGQTGAGYTFDPIFLEAYLVKEEECFIDFLDDIHSPSQIKKNVRALYGALLMHLKVVLDVQHVKNFTA